MVALGRSNKEIARKLRVSEDDMAAAFRRVARGGEADLASAACLDFLDEVGHEVDVPGVLLEVVGDEVKLHSARRYAGFVMEL